MQVYRHKKSNSLYYVKGPIRDCTNARDGSLMIEYQSAETGETFVRDEAEFKEKFESYQESFEDTLSRQGQATNALMPVLIGLTARLDNLMDASQLALYYPEAQMSRGDVVAMVEEALEEHRAFLTEISVAGLFRPYIVKVQRPIVTNDPTAACLIYNEDRSITVSVALDEASLAWFGDDYKMYAKVRLWVDGTLQLIERIDNQDW